MEDKRSRGEEQLVIFDLAGEMYGVDIACVREIIRLQPITKVPGAPKFVEGVINLRGKVIPVVGMRNRFGLQRLEKAKEGRIVVVDINGQEIGMVVDGVSAVLRIRPDLIEPPSSVVLNLDSEYLRGIAKVDEKLIILLDVDKVLSKADRQAATSMGKTEPDDVAAA